MNAIGTQLRDPINSGLTRWCVVLVKIYGRRRGIREEYRTRFSFSIENEQADKRRYSQTCLAKPNSQARTGARKFFPVQLIINRIGNLTQLICSLLYVMTTYTCLRILYTVACTLNSRLLSGHLEVVAGTFRGYILPVRYGSVGAQLTRLRALCQGTLTSECVWKNLNATVLQVTCIMQQSSRVFFYSRV